MKRLIAIGFGVLLLVGGSIAFAGGYEHTSDDSSDTTEQSQDVETQDEATEADGPGSQVATGADYDGTIPRGLEVAQIAISDHKGDLPAGLANAISSATANHSKADHTQGAPVTSTDDTSN